MRVFVIAVAAALLFGAACGDSDREGEGDGGADAPSASSATPPVVTPAPASPLPGGDTPVTPPGEPPTSGQPSPVGAANPRPKPVPPDSFIDRAPIDDLELIIRESFPPQYAMRIVSGLPDGCHRFHEARIVERTVTTYIIQVTNSFSDDPDIACTQVYGQYESIVELGSGLSPGAEYTVHVNDRALTFVAE